MSRLIGSQYTATLSDKTTTFTSSGTFTASVSAIDYLVVAGGGGGGGQYYGGGGGGAGGFRTGTNSPVVALSLIHI